MTLAELKTRVSQLNAAELAAFAHWFEEFQADAWDRQIEQDSRSGKLDHLGNQANVEFDAGLCTSLPQPAGRRKHIANVTITAEFDDSANRRFRYSLQAIHDDASRFKTVCAIMQNPSFADSEWADATMKRLERAVFEQEIPEFAGVGRLVVVNLFARIQTSGFQGTPADIGDRNDTTIRRAIEMADLVLLAWGADSSHRWRQEAVRQMLAEMPGKATRTTTKHPCYASYSNFLRPE